MTYIEGFVCAVPTANQTAYRDHAAEASAVLRKLGVRRMVEAWAEDVPDGKLTDFRRAVQAKADESVVLSWFEYPSRAARDATNAVLRTDPRLAALTARMPFDGQRLIFGGFAALLEEGAAAPMGYVDGFVLAVPVANKDAYRAVAADAAKGIARHGAMRTIEAWGDDVPDGRLTDFRRAVLAEPDEVVVFSWIEWPSKATREAGWKSFVAEQSMDPARMPFDTKRMIYGGFLPILEA